MFALLKKISSRFHKNGSFFFDVKNITGFEPGNEKHYRLAFRHSSASKSKQGNRLNNQRLEYLGDAVLGAIIADYLYRKYPQKGEGFLTSMRSKIVSRKHLNTLGLQLGLNKFVVKRTARTANAKSIYGDALEALIGALYLDRGYEDCRTFIVNKIIENRIDLDAIENRIASHKGALLEWGQKNRRMVEFSITNTWGESHARKYEVALSIDGEMVSSGQGSSKKKAEEEAARVAYKKFISE